MVISLICDSFRAAAKLRVSSHVQRFVADDTHVRLAADVELPLDADAERCFECWLVQTRKHLARVRRLQLARQQVSVTSSSLYANECVVGCFMQIRTTEFSAYFLLEGQIIRSCIIKKCCSFAESPNFSLEIVIVTHHKIQSHLCTRL